MKWPNKKFGVGREWVSPVVYYKNQKFLYRDDVYGDLIQVSKNRYKFWVGKRDNLHKLGNPKQVLSPGVNGK